MLVSLRFCLLTCCPSSLSLMWRSQITHTPTGLQYRSSTICLMSAFGSIRRWDTSLFPSRVFVADFSVFVAMIYHYQLWCGFYNGCYSLTCGRWDSSGNGVRWWLRASLGWRGQQLGWWGAARQLGADASDAAAVSDYDERWRSKVVGLFVTCLCAWSCTQFRCELVRTEIYLDPGSNHSCSATNNKNLISKTINAPVS